MVQKVRFKNLLRFAAAYCAFFMGSSFISGQEAMQFYTGFGWWGIVGVFLALSVFCFDTFCFQTTIYEEKCSGPFEAVSVLCGRRVGTVFTYISMVTLILNMVMMSAGAGAVVVESYALPNLLGRCLVVGCAAAVVLLGLDRIVDVLSVVGPINIALMVVVAVVACVMMPRSLAEGMALAPEAVALKGASTWWLSAIKFAGTGTLIVIPVYMVVGTKASSLREAKISSFTQFIPLILVYLLLIVAQAGNIQEVSGSEIPNIMLARLYLPWLSKVFGVCILLGTFSSTIVLFWSVVRHWAEEGTRRYRLLTVCLAVGVLIASGLLPFSRIVNLLNTAFFTLGLALLVLVAAGMIRRRKMKNTDGKYR